GRRADPGSTVTITVSLGPEPRPDPTTPPPSPDPSPTPPPSPDPSPTPPPEPPDDEEDEGEGDAEEADEGGLGRAVRGTVRCDLASRAPAPVGRRVARRTTLLPRRDRGRLVRRRWV